MDRCVFLKTNKCCKALNVTKKTMNCEKCKFHLTREQSKEKERKIKDWYYKRGFDYKMIKEAYEEKDGSKR